MANGIMYGCCHKLVSFAEIIQHLEPIDKSHIAYTRRGLHPHGHGEHEQVYVHYGKDDDQSGIGHKGAPGSANRLVVFCNAIGRVQ